MIILLILNSSFLSASFILKNQSTKKSLMILSNSKVNNISRIPVIFDYPNFQYDLYKYHNSTEFYLLAQELANTYPSRVTLDVIGKSWYNRTIYALRITNGDQQSKPVFFIVALHHAREMITAESAFYVAAYFASKYGEDLNVTVILDNLDLIIVPVLNPDGLDIALYQNDWQRKNARWIDEDNDSIVDEDPPEDINGDGLIEYYQIYDKNRVRWIIGFEGVDNDNDSRYGEDWLGGVDLNRNYPYAWGEVPGLGSPQTEVYQGPKPVSEPEIRALVELMNKSKPIISLSLHSGIEALLYPWGYWTRVSNFEFNVYQNLLRNAKIVTGWRSMIASSLYPASGVWQDWAFGQMHSLALTAEIYGNNLWPVENMTENETHIKYCVYGIKWRFNPDIAKEKEKFEDTLAKVLALVKVMGLYGKAMIEDNSPPTIELPDFLEAYLESDQKEIQKRVFRFGINFYDNESGILSAQLILSDKENSKVIEGYVPLYTNSWVLELNLSEITPGTYNVTIKISNRGSKTFEARVATINIQSATYAVIDWDSDNDHLADIFEAINGANPNNPDTDGDGITDGEEFKKGGWYAVLHKPEFPIIYIAILIVVVTAVIGVIVVKIRSKRKSL